MNTYVPCNVKPTIAVSPETGLEEIHPYLEEADMVLMMTVSPGFAGQKFIQSVITKIKKLREFMQEKEYKPLIEVDGNIHTNIKHQPDVYVLETSGLFHNKKM